MPRLHDIEEKCLFGLQVDKENDEVFFNEESHTYKDKYDGSDYISATQLIGKYKQPFDENFWSSYKALEAVMGTEGFSVLKPILLQSKI